MEGDVKISLQDFLEMRDENVAMAKNIAEMKGVVNKAGLTISKLYIDAIIALFKTSPKYQRGESILEVQPINYVEGEIPTSIIIAMTEDSVLKIDKLQIKFGYGKIGKK